MGDPSLPPARSGRRRVTMLPVSNMACVCLVITLAGTVGHPDASFAQQVASMQGRPHLRQAKCPPIKLIGVRSVLSVAGWWVSVVSAIQDQRSGWSGPRFTGRDATVHRTLPATLCGRRVKKDTFFTQPDNIHWTPDTAQRILADWCTQLHFH
ncbi:unnamed protein product [Boreogadus saida]